LIFRKVSRMPLARFRAVSDWLPAAVRNAGIERALTAGQTLFRLGDATAGFYEVVGGQLRLTRVDTDGRQIVLHVAAPGETIAEASLFSPSYHCDAIATTDAVVRLYPKAVVLDEFQRNPEVAQAFMAMLAHQVMNLRTRLEQRNIRSARDRIRHYLALNAGPDGRTVLLRGTVKDLAAELGLTHEALYRALSELAAQGEIERLEGKIRLARRFPYDPDHMRRRPSAVSKPRGRKP
jgi:CRP/FNR family transcriptional regulator, dissimilatory nitrate respiration regulator